MDTDMILSCSSGLYVTMTLYNNTMHWLHSGYWIPTWTQVENLTLCILMGRVATGATHINPDTAQYRTTNLDTALGSSLGPDDTMY